MKRYAASAIGAILIAAAVLAGCAQTTRTTEAVQYESQSESRSGEPVVVERRTETTTTTEREGILSSTVDVVGEVLALPFRAVGALIRLIF